MPSPSREFHTSSSVWMLVFCGYVTHHSECLTLEKPGHVQHARSENHLCIPEARLTGPFPLKDEVKMHCPLRRLHVQCWEEGIQIQNLEFLLKIGIKTVCYNFS